jgi:hypothetical protein
MWPRVDHPDHLTAAFEDVPLLFDGRRGRKLNSPPSTQPPPSPSPHLPAVGFPSEVRTIQAWFDNLNGAERAAAFSAIAQLAAPHETPFLRPPRARQWSTGRTGSNDRTPCLAPIGTPPDSRGSPYQATGKGNTSSCSSRAGGPLGGCFAQDGSICCPSPSGESDWLCSWLRSLRLHKYSGCLKNLTMDELLALDDKGLQNQGVNTFGARKKLISVCAFPTFISCLHRLLVQS